jgi:glycosyltransferase involved in cell wall biosynthesis
MAESAPHRIAFGITDLDVGGAEKALVSLIERLDRRRWDPMVFCLQPAGPLAERLQSRHIPVISFEMTSPWGIPRVLGRWTKRLREWKPSILQTFLFHANVLGTISARRARVPVIVHGIRVAERRRNYHGVVNRLFGQLADCHVCVSEETARFHHDSTGIPFDRIRVIPNAVDAGLIHDAHPVSWPMIEHAHPKFICVGRLDHQKGVELLLRAFHRWHQTNAEPHGSLVFVGEGAERGQLTDEIGRLGLHDRVHLVGFQDRPHDWIAAADVFVLASRWEGMPNVVLEAMALGKPIVATRVEGVAALVEDHVNGWIAPPNCVSSLANALGKAAAHSSQWKEMGQLGRDKVIQHCSWNAVVQQYESLWLELIGQKTEHRFEAVSDSSVQEPA